MGVWGVGPFDNDDAADWAALFPDGGFGAVWAELNALANVAEADESTALRAVAACELVAWMVSRGGNGSVYGEDAIRWASGVSADGELVAAAIRAIDALSAPGSWLRDMWVAADDADSWMAVVGSIRSRLGSPSSSAAVFDVDGGGRVLMWAPAGVDVWLGAPTVLAAHDDVMVLRFPCPRDADLLVSLPDGSCVAPQGGGVELSAVTVSDTASWRDEGTRLAVERWVPIAANVAGGSLVVVFTPGG